MPTGVDKPELVVFRHETWGNKLGHPLGDKGTREDGKEDAKAKERGGLGD